MENLTMLLHGFELAITPTNLLFCLIGVTVGQVVGVLPGLGPVAGTAMLIPLTYGLSPTTAVIMLFLLFTQGFSTPMPINSLGF